MPAIIDLLPTARIAAIKAHVAKPEFVKKVKTAIADLRAFVKHPGVNQDVTPTIWVSYGKDSMAMWLLCEEAGIKYIPCVIDNNLEFPQHYSVFEEFDNWLGIPPIKTFTTERDGIDYLAEALDIARSDRKSKKPTTKPPIDFFNPQEAYDIFYSFVAGRFHWEHIGKNKNTLHLWSTRGSEGMGRQWELSRCGKLFQPSFSLKPGQTPIWRGLPVGDWQDLDIWAWLMVYNPPVSPVYGMNELPQRGVGRNAAPRTLWYCDSHVFNPTFVRWLKKYAPAQLSEVIQYFPEVKEKLLSPKKGEASGVSVR